MILFTGVTLLIIDLLVFYKVFSNNEKQLLKKLFFEKLINTHYVINTAVLRQCQMSSAEHFIFSTVKLPLQI